MVLSFTHTNLGYRGSTFRTTTRPPRNSVGVSALFRKCIFPSAKLSQSSRAVRGAQATEPSRSAATRLGGTLVNECRYPQLLQEAQRGGPGATTCACCRGDGRRARPGCGDGGGCGSVAGAASGSEGLRCEGRRRLRIEALASGA